MGADVLDDVARVLTCWHVATCVLASYYTCVRVISAQDLWLSTMFKAWANQHMWWRTTPSPPRHDITTPEEPFCARGSIRLSLLLYFFIMDLLTRTCLSGSSFISSLPLGFRVGSSLFGIPFVKLILLCEPFILFLWVWVWVVGLKWALSSLGPPRAL